MRFVRYSFGAISLGFLSVLGWCLSPGVISALFSRYSSRYQDSALLVSDVDVPSLPHPTFQSDIVSIVPWNVVTSFGIALLSQGRYLSSCFSSYLLMFASRGLSHHSVLSFPNQSPRLGTICGETAELEDRKHSGNTPPHLSRHSKKNS